jgi:DNA-binding LacI/PurR family transcriptional regulator
LALINCTILHDDGPILRTELYAASVTTRLAEVAAFAGVSIATVGRVLNNRPGIAQSTRDAVLTALDVLGFERPAAAGGERAGLVGLVVPDLLNPIFPGFVEAVSVGLVKQGLMPVLCTRTADGVSEANYIKLLLSHRVAGIIFIGGSYADAGPEYCRELRELKMPLVLVNPADVNGLPRVCVDDAAATERALGHLSSLGHERIGLVLGPVGHVPSARKLGAYVAYGQKHRGKESWRDRICHTTFSMEGGGVAATRLLAEGVTALVCASDALALGAIRTAKKQGLAVPGDLSVIGFDDSVYMVVTDPALTTLRQPVQAMGAAAVELLAAQIGGRPARDDEMSFEPELIVRSSTGIRRA